MKHGEIWILGGIYWPQNAEYIRTVDMVKIISDVSHHRIRVSRFWNWMVVIAAHVPGKMSTLVNKAFGNLSYDQEMSQCGFEYQIVSFRESIERIESKWKM